MMKQIRPQSSAIVSFEAHAVQRPLDFIGEIDIEEQDDDEYVFEIATNDDKSMIAAALSNRSIVLFDNNMNSLGKFDGHGGTVHDVLFASHDVVLSACEDRIVRGWDVRTKNKVFEIEHEYEVLNMSLGCGGTMLATAAGMGAHFTDMRTVKRIGHYSDNHTDLVTQVCFNNGGAEIATGSEDGLVCLYDTRQAQAEESLQCVINADCPVRKIGFFAPGGEGVFVLTGSETLSLWHKNTAQCINPQYQDVRAMLKATSDMNTDYLVNCEYVQDKLILTAGDWTGVATICEVTDSACTPIARLESGHRAMLRSSTFLNRGLFLLTGAEDSRICAWDLEQQQANETNQMRGSGPLSARPRGCRKSGGGGGRESHERDRRGPY